MVLPPFTVSQITDASLMTLGITQTFYETAMYLFVFLWVPALELVAPMEEKLPFGIIFSAFMCCMSLGSAIYGIASTTGPSSESSVRRHATLAIVTCLVAAVALVTSATSYNLPVRFWAFCAFEATVGMYFPILGTLRGALIPDEARASVGIPLSPLTSVRCAQADDVSAIPWSSTFPVLGCFPSTTQCSSDHLLAHRSRIS